MPLLLLRNGYCHTEAASVDPLYLLHLETTETVTHKQPLLCPAQKQKQACLQLGRLMSESQKNR